MSFAKGDTEIDELEEDLDEDEEVLSDEYGDEDEDEDDESQLAIVDNDKENTDGKGEVHPLKQQVSSTPRARENGGGRGSKRLNFSKVVDHHLHSFCLLVCLVVVVLVVERIFWWLGMWTAGGRRCFVLTAALPFLSLQHLSDHHELSESNDSSDEKMMITFGEDGDSN